MTRAFEEQAITFHRALPGFIRATLLDYGLSHEVIDRRRLGWDGRSVTVPVVNPSGSVGRFERWDAVAIGISLDRDVPVDLYPLDALSPPPARLLVAEGVHEALVFESVGLPAVTATGTGRFFKAREWGPLLQRVPEVVVAFRRGPRSERRQYLLTRAEVIKRITRAVPHARVLEWPREVGQGGGALAFFKRRGRSVEDFEQLLV